MAKKKNLDEIIETLGKLGFTETTEEEFDETMNRIDNDLKCDDCFKNGLKKPYEQHIVWDTEALIELSDVLINDIKIVEINDNSNFYVDYLNPIETNNTLADIIKAVQEYYNKVKKEHRRSCFYIEAIVVDHITDKIIIQVQHGT